jgi:hypothetical protein
MNVGSAAKAVPPFQNNSLYFALDTKSQLIFKTMFVMSPDGQLENSEFSIFNLSLCYEVDMVPCEINSSGKWIWSSFSIRNLVWNSFLKRVLYRVFHDFRA